MRASITLKHQNNLIVTPQVQQSMEILQLSVHDLNKFLQEIAAENPLMEFKPVSYRKKYSAGSHHNAKANDWWLQIRQDAEETLESYLLEQIKYLNLDKLAFGICKFLIGNLDERGYLHLEPEWIADHLHVSIEQVEEALKLIQGLEPAGVAAFSLIECLLLQLENQQENCELLYSLVAHDLGDIAKGKIKQLANKYGVETSDIQHAVRQIAKLDPRPGAKYNKGKPQYVVPDIVLRHTDGHFELVMDEETVPLLYINAHYEEMMRQGHSKEVSKFLKEKFQHVKWIMQCLELRKATLLKVANVIFNKQSEFCLKGSSYIRPLTMAQVAEELQIHESTVSRTVNNKYVMTPWGVYELKHFFTASNKQSDGSTVSAFRTKHLISEIINNEDKTNPYSDQAITELLRQENIIVSRRTVAKYREQMHIGSTMQRKEY